MLLYSLTYVVQNIPHHVHVFFFGVLYVWTHVITQTGIQVHSVTMGSYKSKGWVS